MLGIDPREVDVPVVGGHSGVTILPLLSQVRHSCFQNHFLIFSSCRLKLSISRFWLFRLLEYYYFLQVKPACTFTADEIHYLTDRIQNGGTEVVKVINL